MSTGTDSNHGTIEDILDRIEEVARTGEDRLADTRICRIASFPTREFPGSGLPGYYLCKNIKGPTLFLTRKTGEPVDVPPHVDLRMIDHSSPLLGEKIDPLKAASKLPGLMKFFLSTVRPMTRFKPEIVHIHSPLYILHAVWAKFILGSRVCMTFHGSDLLRIKRSRILQKLLPCLVDLFFYVSPSMAADLAQFIPVSRMIHTPNGVDLDNFNDRNLKREKRIVAVGNLRWQKGYEYLLDAFASLDAPGYSLAVLGDGPLRDAMEKRIEKLGMEDRIFLPGRKSHEEIAYLLNRSEIFVMSSVSEGFPKALVEAIASGLPVVTTDVGCCRELTGEAGICVAPGDADALAAALARLIDDGDLRKGFSRKASESAVKYGWEKPCETVREAYEKIVS